MPEISNTTVVITGEGIVSAIGCTKDEVLRSLLSRRSGIGQMQYLRSQHTEFPVGEVHRSNGEMMRDLGIEGHEELSRTILMGIRAVADALADAGINRAEAEEKGRRIVLISGTTVGGMDITEEHFDGIADLADRDFLQRHDGGSCTDYIAHHFGLFADCSTISTACSSAANALAVGADMLRRGEADVVVCGGTEALSRFHLNGFASLMILDHRPCRPFCATREGLNLGEGAAYVVMERADDAARRGAPVHAYLSGYGIACDAYHQTASSPDGEGAFRAMSEALRMARLRPADVDYVNAHGTGTPDNDRSESAALSRVFGEAMPPVSSTKAFTGHTTSASGSIEAVICLLAMRHGFIPANLNLAEPMADGITPSPGREGAALHHVVCNSFGFGGNDTSLVFSDHPSEYAGEAIGEEESKKIRVVSKVEITPDDDLSAVRRYVSAGEARRMGRLMKASLLASLRALEEAGVTCPDAIVTGTAYGCIENSERLLDSLIADGEGVTVKPTLFMQSTHNTLGSNIAIVTRCHGANLTITQGDRSLRQSIDHARRLLDTGRCRTVLVGCHDEATPLFARLYADILGHEPLPVHSIAMVLTNVESNS